MPGSNKPGQHLGGRLQAMLGTQAGALQGVHSCVPNAVCNQADVTTAKQSKQTQARSKDEREAAVPYVLILQALARREGETSGVQAKPKIREQS